MPLSVVSRLVVKPSCHPGGQNRKKQFKNVVALFFTAILGFSSPVFSAQPQSKEKQHFDLPNLTHSIELDGELNEAVWQQANTVELRYENDPGENTPAPVKTTAYYFEDGETLYIGFDAKTPPGDNIRANFNDRDGSWNDDQVSIIVDTFNDERRAYQFFLNPLGVQSDSIIDDVNKNEDISWDAIWDGAGAINDSGYTVEMAIPLRALRFNENLKQQIWGIEFIRFYPREKRYRLSSMPRDRNSACNLCQLDKISGFKSITSNRNLNLVPSLTTLKTETRDNVNQSNWQSDGVDSELSADIRWGINQDLYLYATINPDFSQVEADSAKLSVNNTFSLFFPEKRAFFLDGADYFNTPNQLVYTRNIATPDYGVKLTGKSNSHTYGVIAANDSQTQFISPSSQGSRVVELEGESDVFISRWRSDVGERHSIGGLVTHRSANDYRNQVVAVDGLYWFTENDSLEWQITHTSSKTPEANSDSGSGSDSNSEQNDIANTSGQSVTLRYEHQDRDWRWFVHHVDFDEDFRADLGFITRVDFSRSLIGARRFWYFSGDDFLTRMNIHSDYDITKDQNGQLLEEEVEVWFNFSGQHQFEGWFGGGRRERFITQDFELEFIDGVDRDAPDYQPEFHQFTISDSFYETFYSTGLFIRPVAHLKVGFRGNFGDRIDVRNVQLGKQYELSPELEWLINRNAKLGINYTHNRLNVDGGELFNAEIVNFKLTYQQNVRQRIKLTAQYFDIERNPERYGDRYRVVADPLQYFIEPPNQRSKDLALQLLYSYKVNPQTLVFVGYSTHGYQDDDISGIEQDQRSLFAKFSYAFQI